MQRLDKILSSAGAGSRKDLRAAIRAGRVRVNGEVCRDESAKFDEQAAEITLDGEAVELLRPALILLNKPAGYLTAADDPGRKPSWSSSQSATGNSASCRSGGSTRTRRDFCF